MSPSDHCGETAGLVKPNRAGRDEPSFSATALDRDSDQSSSGPAHLKERYIQSSGDISELPRVTRAPLILSHRTPSFWSSELMRKRSATAFILCYRSTKELNAGPEIVTISQVRPSLVIETPIRRIHTVTCVGT